MSLVSLAGLTVQRAAQRRGLGAFNVIHLEHAETLVAAAERAGQPVVLQISQNAVAYHRGLAPLANGALAVARSARVPVAVHLDHAESVPLIEEAVRLGFTSVMYDGAALPFAANVATTAAVVRFCRASGVSVEAELGQVGGKDGAHAPGARTDPTEARRFVELTGVDLLAVAVGSSHAMTERDATLDTGLIGRLAEAVPVPLVLHGSSGVSDAGMRAAIRAGITKVNVSTHLNVVFTRAVRDFLDGNPAVVDTRKYLGPAVDAIGREAERLLRWYDDAAADSPSQPCQNAA
ncbi:MAG: class II fructose-bisphosphate aldolase family protein [Propionibacteriaceae bacterium]|jgi:ketose-bisphosphate aldolase|nr:class II fructose-bisphosphate aldolase family protein [Propionibacteriaceae bacterium]